MKIHHLGYAVKDLDVSIIKFKSLGYEEYNERVVDEDRKVIIQFMKNGSYLIELISPLNENSPINNILKKIGCGPYHICYETNDIEKQIDELLKDKFILIQKPEEAIAIDSKRVAFLFKKSVGIIELIEV